MRKAIIPAFEDFIAGTFPVTVYTSTRLNDALGQFDKLGLQAISDQVTTATTLTVQIEHSSDERNWVSKNGTAEINAVTIAANTTTNSVGSDAGTSASLGKVRLRITINGTGSGQAHVKILVCARDDS